MKSRQPAHRNPIREGKKLSYDAVTGLSAYLSPNPLKLNWRPLIRDALFYCLSIILLFIFMDFWAEETPPGEEEKKV